MRPLISELRSVFKFRHWLAHGRFWQIGRKYDFQTLYLLADVFGQLSIVCVTPQWMDGQDDAAASVWIEL